MKRTVIFLFCCLGLLSYGQHPDLESEDFWILQNLKIGGVDYPAPSNSEISEVPMRIYFDYDIYVFETYICELMTAYPGFNGNDDLELFNLFDPQLGTCALQENDDYEVLYFGFYEESIVYTYTIETQGDFFILTIDHPNGDQAIYRRMILGVAETEAVYLQSYPNPAHDIVYVRSKDVWITQIYIRDIQGNVVLTIEDNSESGIDVSFLAAGLYFIEATSTSGTSVSKFIKD